jgi:hypothetical protein
VSDGVKLEARGTPTVTICSTAFAGAGQRQAMGRGMASLPIIEIPHPMHSAPVDAVTARAESAVQNVVDALTRRSTETTVPITMRLPEMIELDADPVAVQEYFTRRDGAMACH